MACRVLWPGSTTSQPQARDGQPHTSPNPKPQETPALQEALNQAAAPPHRAARPPGASHLVGGPAAGEEVPIIVTVQGDVENVGVPVEDLLGPIAMVNILGGERSWGSALK